MLKIVLSGRGLALTVQLFGRAAGGCGLCAETLALLALGILALEESLAGGLVRLGRGEGIYGKPEVTFADHFASIWVGFSIPGSRCSDSAILLQADLASSALSESLVCSW